ncbi:MAG: DUF4867 family protein [Bacteroidales bacterium]|jgi:hypothetical protein|nr:DUF4867 family protein [Bacteroidales bacterium]
MKTTIQTKNPDKRIMSVQDDSFKAYGKYIKNLPVNSLIDSSLSLFCEKEGTKYVTNHTLLEENIEALYIKRTLFGEMDIQVGCCYGINSTLNGMEYHAGEEVIIASTDIILMLGKVEEIDEVGMWDSSLTQFFYLNKGEAVQLYTSTLHLAPCRVDEKPFNAIIILPKGTNEALEESPIGTLFKKNKWMLAHKEGPAVKQGAKVCVTGENLSILY